MGTLNRRAPHPQRMDFDQVRESDPAVADALRAERDRQHETLSMIASENHVSPAVIEAQGSPLTNKYAEGYPGARYYGGCEHVDRIEELARDRAADLWDAEHVNVQPHSGTQANMAVYFAMLEPGDTILSLALDDGGHLSHGHRVNFTGKLYDVERYAVDPETGYIDYEDLEDTAQQVNPDIIVSGYSAYPRTVEWQRFQTVADDVGALHLADIAHITGLVAAGEHPSPVGIADFVTGSTHKTIRAGRGGIIMTDEEYADEIDSSVFPGSQGGPLMHNIAGKAVGFAEAMTPEFREYARQVVLNAEALGEGLLDRGFALSSGGTDTHLVLADLRESHPDVSGGDAESALESCGIVLNANTVPDETRSPFDPSGIRVGTPALTTRGMSETEMFTIADLIADVVDDLADGGSLSDETRTDVQTTVDEICTEYPLYQN
jgi:glycine hydroxymethyltransferase